MKKALETMPMTLDDAFRRILERVESQDPMSATTALRTLTWVYYARRPLTIAELGEALVVEEGDPNRREDAIIESISIIDCCLSLITHDQERVRFIHPSVPRWFDEEPQHGKLSESYIAKTCLTYLNYDVFDSRPPGYDIGARHSFSRRYTERHVFSRYASQFWHDHARNVEDKVDVQELAFLFLGSENKRRSMLIVAQDCEPRGDRLLASIDYADSLPVLHFLAARGLTTFCHILLNAPRGRYLILVAWSNTITISKLELLLPSSTWDQSPSKDARDYQNDWATKLSLAERYGYEKTVKLFLEAKAEVNTQKDRNGRTALHWAAFHGCEKVVELLLGAKAEVNARDKSGQMALHLAAIHGNEKTVELLLGAKAEANAKDKSGQIALHLAIIHGNDKIVGLLLRANAEVNAQEDGGTVLHLAVSHGNEKTVELLLNANAEVNVLEEHGRTPLHLAANRYGN